MNIRTRNRLLAAITIATPVIALALPASAQQRVNQDGRALDANTRVGSDGSNDVNNGIDRRGYTANQVVTGNVSAARAFRGPVPYRDPLEFTGPIGGSNIDRFIRDSAGAPTRSNPNVDYGFNPTAYYDDRRSTPVPAGFRAEGYTGGFFNTGAAQQTVAGRAPQYQSTSQVFSNYRPGVFIDAGVDQNNQQNLLYASPLSGVMPANDAILGAGVPSTRTEARTPANRTRLTPAEIERLRREVSEGRQEDGQTEEQPADPNSATDRVDPARVNDAVGAPGGENTTSPRANAAAARNQRGGDAVDVQRDARINARIDASVNADRLAAGQQNREGVNRALAVPPSKQSAQYAALHQRLLQLQSTGDQQLSPEEANMEIRRLRQAQNAGAAEDPNAKPGDPKKPAGGGLLAQPRVTPRTGKTGAGAATPKGPAAEKPAVKKPAVVQPKADRPAPLRVKSLAEGVQAKGLKDLLLAAEEQLKAGNFKAAIDKYADAERVAPNNALLRLGSAQAYIAAARYRTAEEHLRQALLGDSALLMGQYDLEALIGRERLSFIIKDLQKVAQTEATSSRPMILLAYIAYGQEGQETAAADYLNQAAERAGKPDPLIDAMRKHWVLPEVEAQPDANK